jgi:BirA family biotin operon repressor/biotin-[acetyl-CoA-carboxylase] ligase
MAFPFNRKPAELAGLSLLTGLATIEGIAQACRISENDLYRAGLRLKWPNDLLLNNAKLGGILIEGGQAKPGDPSWMIVGVGINVRNADIIEKNLEPNGLGLKISAIEKLIPPETETPENEQICLAILASFEKHFQNFDQSGFAPYQKDWLKWDAFANQKVCITGAGNGLAEGIAKGVDTNGAFLLEQETKIIAIYAGDVSLRLQS